MLFRSETQAPLGLPGLMVVMEPAEPLALRVLQAHQVVLVPAGHQELPDLRVVQVHPVHPGQLALTVRQEVVAPPGHREAVRCSGGTVIDILSARKQMM